MINKELCSKCGKTKEEHTKIGDNYYCLDYIDSINTFTPKQSHDNSFRELIGQDVYPSCQKNNSDNRSPEVKLGNSVPLNCLDTPDKRTKQETTNISSLISEVEKGCGKRIRFEDINTKCGGKVGDIGIIKRVYCPVCQAKLQTLQKVEEMIEDFEYSVPQSKNNRDLIEDIKREIVGLKNEENRND